MTDAELLERFPDVRLDHDNAPHHRGLLERQYLVHRCGACGWWHDPPRAVCPRCWSDQVIPSPIEGRGTIAALTRIHGVPSSAPDPADGAPWPLAAIELTEQEGLRIAGHLVGPMAATLDIGDPVQLVWLDDGGRPRAAFEGR